MKSAMWQEVKFVRGERVPKCGSINFFFLYCMRNFCIALLGSDGHALAGMRSVMVDGAWKGQEQSARQGTQCNSVQLHREC